MRRSECRKQLNSETGITNAMCMQKRGLSKFNPEKMEESKARSSGELSFAFPSQTGVCCP